HGGGGGIRGGHHRHRAGRADPAIRPDLVGPNGRGLGSRVEGKRREEVNQELIVALKELEREKGIPFQTILAGLEEALASAYKSYKRQHDPELEEETTGVRVQLDPESGEMRAWMQVLEEETGEVLSEKEEE